MFSPSATDSIIKLLLASEILLRMCFGQLLANSIDDIHFQYHAQQSLLASGFYMEHLSCWTNPHVWYTMHWLFYFKNNLTQLAISDSRYTKLLELIINQVLETLKRQMLFHFFPGLNLCFGGESFWYSVLIVVLNYWTLIGCLLDKELC